MALMVIGSDRAQDFFETAKKLAPERDIRIWPDVGEPKDIRFALAWRPPAGVLASFPNLQVVVSVGAGVDHLLGDPQLPDVPIVRYVNPDLTGRMVEYVSLHTLLHGRRMLEFQELQRQLTWKYLPEPAAHQIRVGIMGLGVLGQAAARALGVLGYQMRGWSRTSRAIEGMECFSGDAELDAFLNESDVLVVLLPLTPATSGILNRRLFQRLSLRGRHPRLPGPILINAGRGGLQIEADILTSLEAGELYAASLDVFETEPLPDTSPLWQHPRVVITPHNAAESTDESVVAYFLRQVDRAEHGESLENIVDQDAGY